MLKPNQALDTGSSCEFIENLITPVVWFLFKSKVIPQHSIAHPYWA